MVSTTRGTLNEFVQEAERVFGNITLLNDFSPKKNVYLQTLKKGNAPVLSLNDKSEKPPKKIKVSFGTQESFFKEICDGKGAA